MNTTQHEHNIENRFVLSLILTGLIFIAEVVGGIATGSLALLSDAAHVFMDVLALGMSYGAMRLAARPADESHTYGFHRFKVLAALVNGITLFIIAFEILQEAWSRFQNPEPIIAGSMLVIAIIGLAVNLIVALVLRDHDHDDLNTRSAFLHVLGDVLASVGVIVGGVIILLTGWYWVDALVSVFVALIILLGSGRVLRETLHILNEGSPPGMEVSRVADHMLRVADVKDIHDLHIWSVSPGYIALSAHVVLDDQTVSQTQGVLAELKALLAREFDINHTTIQFECSYCGQGDVALPNNDAVPVESQQ